MSRRGELKRIVQQKALGFRKDALATEVDKLTKQQIGLLSKDYKELENYIGDVRLGMLGRHAEMEKLYTEAIENGFEIKRSVVATKRGRTEVVKQSTLEYVSKRDSEGNFVW